MDLSVVIVSYKGYTKLNRCLGSLASFKQDKFTMEVIIVNNNPGDELFKETEIKYTQFRFLHNRVNGGYSNGCNLGCAEASGDYFLILNPDTLATEEAFFKLLEVARTNPLYHIISCRQIKENGTESRAYGKFPWHVEASKIDNQNIVFPGWVSGSVMLMHRDIYKNLKGFDEDFWMYYEDVDFCRRARNAGGEIAFYNEITIVHDHGSSSRSDPGTAAMAKCEVQSSRHLYISKHEAGLQRKVIQALIVTDNLITGIITGIAGLIFFFVPRLFVRFLFLLRLISYYSGAIARSSWISTRSVNYIKK